MTPLSYLSPFLKYLTYNFNDLEIRQFKAIPGQRSIARAVSHSASIDPAMVSVTVFEIFGVKAIFS